MKISAIKAKVAQHDEGVTIPIEGEDGEPYTAADGSPATMTIVGSESTRLRAVIDKQTRRVLRNQVTKATVEMVRSERIEKATAAVIDWHGFEDEQGKAIPCTSENVAEVLGAAQYVLEQVESGVRRYASFFAKSSTG